MKVILVAGATGMLGGEICRRLLARGEAVRALVRRTADPVRTAALEQRGAALTRGDLRDRPSLDAACTEVTFVISTVTSTASRQPGDSIEATDQEGQLNLVEAAKAADVPHFIYVSYSGSLDGGDHPSPLTIAKRSVEQRLRKSGMTYSILRPSFIMEVWLSPMLGFDYANAKATCYGQGLARISYIALGDVAEFAVNSLDNPAARNAVIELGGPEQLSLLEVVAIFEQVAGGRFEVVFVPVGVLRAQKAAATDSLQMSLAALMLAQTNGDSIDMGEPLKSFPITLTSVRQYAEHALQA